MISSPTVEEAESLLKDLSAAFLASPGGFFTPSSPSQASGAGIIGPDYEARYKALIEHIPGVIFVAPLEAGSGDAYVSPQIERILGYSQEEWLGDPLRWYESVHPEDKARWSIEAAALFLSGEPLSSTYRVAARDGRTVWFQCDARMVHSNDGRNSFIHGIGFDVSELKETEESLRKARNELETRVEERTEALARANAKLKEEIAEHKQTELLLIAAKEAAETSARVKSQFMANMSHEIRTPMNGVLGLTSLVLNTELTAEQREHLSTAHSSAESLLSIINEILDFSKLESGRTELHPAEFSVRKSIENLVSQLKVQAEQKGLELSYDISQETPDVLVGDAGRLGQVLINLIGNAIKFTQKGRVRLEIAKEEGRAEEERSACTLRFSVVDSGIGMKESTLEAIFEPFVQADGSITRQYGGTGLGLAISKELITLMGGQINVISAPGRGSTFSFAAKFKTGTNGLERTGLSSPQPTVQVQEAVKHMRVLVAEDNPVNQMVVTGVLKKQGHSITLANNGQEALEAFCGSSFDIILMDVQMPVMDGLSATEAIREAEALETNSHIPIIGLSAHALEIDRTRCMDAGMDGYLSKPFRAAELCRLVQELTTRSKSG